MQRLRDPSDEPDQKNGGKVTIHIFKDQAGVSVLEAGQVRESTSPQLLAIQIKTSFRP